MKTTSTSRRELLRAAAKLSAFATLSPLALSLFGASKTMASTTASNYRALIYIDLFGGNDSQNVVLATDPQSWQTYLKYRDTSGGQANTESIALDQNSLLNIGFGNASAQNVGRSFALHPSLAYIQSQYNAKRVAIVPNVGPLINPLTADQFKNKTAPIPKDLFSHSAQEALWQAFDSDFNYGWGGHMADLLQSQNSVSAFTCMSMSGNCNYLNGTSVTPIELGYGPVQNIDGLSRNGKAATSIYDGVPSSSSAALSQLLNRSSSSPFQSDILNISANAISHRNMLSQSLLPASSVPAPPAATGGLGSQFATILRVMASAKALGVKRQIFFVKFGSFDTHFQQLAYHAEILSKLDQSVQYFDSVANALGLQGQSTMFTASDFGRTFTSNGSGTDHGWGAHHFVIGDGVNGGDIFGRFPTLGPNNPDNVNTALLPAISVDQYGATLAKWMGVSDSDLNTVFPNLPNFTTRDLGFMKS